MNRILVIDDEADMRLLLTKFFTKKGFEVLIAENGEEGIQLLKDQEITLVLCDFKLPDYTGLEILQKIKIINPTIPVIIITGYSDVRIAVEALKKGAFDYVTKPIYPDEILLTVNKALKQPTTLSTDQQPTPAQKTSNPTKEYIIGKSQSAQTVQKHIELIAPTDMSVIILGETGTGKEYVAKAIHHHSDRKNKNFVAIDCGALPDELAGSELFGHVKGAFTGALDDKVGSFERANGGTLFLDEIGNLSYENQIKLLRVLQERNFKKVGGTKDINADVRVVVATNEDLKVSVSKGEFREDIYHRLNEFRIEMTPLRERPEDIEHFAHHFLSQSNQQLDKNILDFDEETLQILKSYYWHGNLRELGNVIKRAVLLCQSTEVTKTCLPLEITEVETNLSTDELQISLNGNMPQSLKAVVESAEKFAIMEVLKRTNNNKTKTAKILQVDRKTLYNKISQYDIPI